MPDKGGSATIIPAVYAYNPALSTAAAGKPPGQRAGQGGNTPRLFRPASPEPEQKNPATGRPAAGRNHMVTTNDQGPVYSKRTASAMV